MIQVCCFRNCGVVYGEKEPLSDKRISHGLCPKHLEISRQEIRAEVEKAMQGRGAPRILIVEDSAPFRVLFKETLQDRFPSVEIHEAVDAEEGWQEIETFRPDLVFMDIRLPGENGLELTRRVKARYPEIIVIMLTGYDLSEYREFASQYADYFFAKDSLTPESVFNLLETLLPARI